MAIGVVREQDQYDVTHKNEQVTEGPRKSYESVILQQGDKKKKTSAVQQQTLGFLGQYLCMSYKKRNG